jgi:hypothetical protein
MSRWTSSNEWRRTKRFSAINERIEEGAAQHGVEQPLPLHCECAAASCVETIELAPVEYDRVASHVAWFVLIPAHEQSEVDSVVERSPLYLVVEKVGKARAEIEREHPRPRVGFANSGGLVFMGESAEKIATP